MRWTVDLKISAPLGDGGRACIPPSTRMAILVMEALFPWVAEATSNALATEVLLPLGRLDLTVGLLCCTAGHLDFLLEPWEA
jgi:hypothetical protein